MGPEGRIDPNAVTPELAACAVLMELVRSGRVITHVADVTMGRGGAIEFPGEAEEAEVIRRFARLVVERLAELGPEVCWQAAETIKTIRELLVQDLRGLVAEESRRN